MWIWSMGLALFYVASCPLVEAWYDSAHAKDPVVLPVSMPASRDAVKAPKPPATASGQTPPSTNPGSSPEFQIAEVSYTEAVVKPAWMRFLYAPVHWLAEVPGLKSAFTKYRTWCAGLM